jgi:hypothetical protein
MTAKFTDLLQGEWTVGNDFSVEGDGDAEMREALVTEIRDALMEYSPANGHPLAFVAQTIDASPVFDMTELTITTTASEDTEQ